MAKVLELVFRKDDATGRKMLKIPEPPADIDTQLTTLEDYMTNYLEGKMSPYNLFDEATVVETSENELIDKM